jgi:hypothetical protein
VGIPVTAICAIAGGLKENRNGENMKFCTTEMNPGVTVALGVAIGVSIGTATKHLAEGVAIGVALGSLLGWQRNGCRQPRAE